MPALLNVPHSSLLGSSPWKRVLELDGLRAWAILPVILFHCYPEDWPVLAAIGKLGWIGVDLFFVISGYLITGILLNTVDSPDYYRNFIIRRTLRIFPLYYACLVLFTIAAAVSSQWTTLQSWGSVGWFYSYLGNFRAAWIGKGAPIFSFTVLWSLQVEEQFYVFYPALVCFLKRERLRNVLLACVFAAPLLRAILYFVAPDNAEARYVLTPCRMDSLAMGALVALIVRMPRISDIAKRQIRMWAGPIVLLWGIVAVVSNMDRNHPLMSVLGYSLNGAVFTLLLTFVLFWPDHKFVQSLRFKPLVYTGQIAYGLYLLHAPASWAVRSVIGRAFGLTIEGHSALSVVITFVASYAAAALSWHYFEAPILRFKDLLTRPSRPVLEKHSPAPASRVA